MNTHLLKFTKYVVFRKCISMIVRFEKRPKIIYQ